MPSKKYRENKKRWYFSRPFLIPVATALLAVLFLSATPGGRATADALYGTFSSWFSGGVTVDAKLGKTPPQQSSETIIKTSYQSINEVLSKYRDWSIAYNNQLKTDKVDIQLLQDYMIIVSNYPLDGGKQISIRQQITTEGETQWSTSIDEKNGRIIHEKLPSGLEFSGYNNNDFSRVVAYKNNTSIDIHSTTVSYDEFMDFVRNIQVN